MKPIIYIAILFLLPLQLQAQKTLTLTLSEAIEMARRNSPEAIAARHAFRASYWNWRSFRAKQLPSLTLTSDPSLNRSIQSVTLEDGSDKFVHRNQLSVDASLEIQQNIALTGGKVLLKTGLERLDMFTDNISSYKSTPVVVGYEQDLFGFNDLKWERRIEPIKYEEAKKSCKDPVILIEQKLDFSCYVPEGFGTGDCIIISDDKLHIIDFKYGQGIFVEAEHNP